MKTISNRFALMAVSLTLGMSLPPALAAEGDMDPSTSKDMPMDNSKDMTPDKESGTAMKEGAMEDNEMAETMKKDAARTTAFADVTELVAAIEPVSGSNVKGSVLFEKVSGGVKVTAKVGGLEPNSKHGIHIHQFGDITAADGTSAGGHYNPEGNDHALPTESKRHAGDLGNLEADDDGNATLTLTVDNISLTSGKDPIVGRAVIIHEKADDGGQPTGNAGSRIGAGVIGISSPGDDSGESAMAK
ncbi:superoxide dismutase family protein [Haloferula sargassicola]|uniref:Superoxide dismutase copper/zinc binding domain-containing protein n=1 Tax=Haloferula sargassicola TaxID=490096 RepID=A0ABP9USE5_9BACT